jgi:3-phosphoshikimate 1-carboxyvinyltransferase
VSIFMNLIVKKTRQLTGKITIPGSKSQSIRALFFALLASKESTISNLLISEDTKDAMRVCENLGATFKETKDNLIIQSHGLPLHPIVDTIHTGNSGITTHFVLPLLGLRKNTDDPIIVDCFDQMRRRPIHALVKTLRTLGLDIQYLHQEGVLPIQLKGHLLGGKAEVDGITSQYLSALLIALPLVKNSSTISVKNLSERPYVDMTLSWLDKNAVTYTHAQEKEMDIYHIEGNQQYKNFHENITGDFSSASYFIAAGVLLEGEIEIFGLDMKESQGDKILISLLQEMGADITISESHLTIRGGKKLQGITIDAKEIPDLLPTLAVIGTKTENKMEIKNVPHARIKETDRIHSMTEGLKSLGARVEEHNDGMTIYPSALHGNTVKSYGDHRTVMALGVAGMLADGITIIEDCQSIQKTFPEYITCMQSLQSSMETQS